MLFRGHDEPLSSLNRGNFLKYSNFGLCRMRLCWKVLFKNAKYTSHYVQKKILSICASKVKKSIREEIENNKIFCSLPPILKSWLRPWSECSNPLIVVRNTKIGVNIRGFHHLLSQICYVSEMVRKLYTRLEVAVQIMTCTCVGSLCGCLPEFFNIFSDKYI
jgi:hypothetical protein